MHVCIYTEQLFTKVEMNSRGYLPSREAGWGSWWHSDSARVSHHSYKGSISALCGYLIKVTLVTHEKSFVQFDSSKNRRGFAGYSGFHL